MGRFTQINAVSALIWAIVIGLAGKAIARFVEVLVMDLRQHELAVVVVIAGLGLALGLRRLYRQPKI